MSYYIGQHIGFVDLTDRGQEIQFPHSETAKWFCAVTNPNCQARASLGLYELGYRSFYPKKRCWVAHARTRTAKEKPLLGRYLFVEVDQPRQSFGAVRAVNGIEGFVSNPDPVRIPAKMVESFRLRQMAGEWDEVASCPLVVGCRIRVMEGQFANMLATVTKAKGRKIDFKLHGENRYGREQESAVRAA